MSAQPAPQPDAFDRWGESVAEQVNPIVVKEIRQGLRTKVFWIFFGLMLFGCFVTALIAYAAAGDRYSDNGRGFFIAFFSGLSLVQFFVIPYSAFRSMAREREDETWVLLTLTGLGPRRVLRGKLLSFILQGVLYTSAAAPFMLFSYFLNGIDLPTIGAVVVVGAVYSIFLTAIGVSAATLAESRIVRSLMHFMLLGTLLMGIGVGLGLAFAFVDEGARMVGNPSFELLVGGLFMGLLTTALLLFEAAAARLSLPTESYARGPRAMFFLQFLTGIGLFVWAYWLNNDDDILVGGAVTMSVYLLVVGLFVASDFDGMSSVHWRARGLSLLKPGAWRGYLLVLFCLALVPTVFISLGIASSHSDHDLIPIGVGAPLYAAIFISLPLLAARWVAGPASQVPLVGRVLSLGIFALASGVPPLVAALLGLKPDVSAINLLNPVVGLANLSREEGDVQMHLALLFGVALLVVSLTLGTLRRLDNRPAVQPLSPSPSPAPEKA